MDNNIQELIINIIKSSFKDIFIYNNYKLDKSIINYELQCV